MAANLRVLALVGGGVLLPGLTLLAPAVRGNMADPNLQNREGAGNLVAPARKADAGIRLEHETLRISCGGETCAFTATYRLTAPQDADTTIEPRFFGTVTSVAVDGRSMPFAPVPAKDPTAPKSRLSSAADPCTPGEKPAATSRLTLELQRGKAASVVVTGSIVPRIESRPTVNPYAVPAPFARFMPLMRLSGDDSHMKTYLACYALWPAGTWPQAEGTTIDLEITMDGTMADPAVYHESRAGHDPAAPALATRRRIQEFTPIDARKRLKVVARDSGDLWLRWQSQSRLRSWPALGISAGAGMRRERAGALPLRRLEAGVGFFDALTVAGGIDTAGGAGRQSRTRLALEAGMPVIFTAIPSLTVGAGLEREGRDGAAVPVGLVAAHWPFVGIRQEFVAGGVTQWLVTLGVGI